MSKLLFDQIERQIIREHKSTWWNFEPSVVTQYNITKMNKECENAKNGSIQSIKD